MKEMTLLADFGELSRAASRRDELNRYVHGMVLHDHAA
jgi:hypothetical protein